MAYNTKNIIRDASGAPIPQLFNPAADEYQPLEGTGGAHKTQLSGSTVPDAEALPTKIITSANSRFAPQPITEVKHRRSSPASYPSPTWANVNIYPTHIDNSVAYGISYLNAKRACSVADGFVAEPDLSPTFDDNVIHVWATATKIMVSTWNGNWVTGIGRIWATDKANGVAGQFTEVLTLPDGVGAYPWNVDSYYDFLGADAAYKRNYVLIAEYGKKTAPGNARRVHLSINGGATFSVIFTGDEVNEYHTHAGAFDKYYDRIWVTNGDGPKNAAIHFSDDLGATWTKISGYQPTVIIPMPDYVLFGADEKPMGIFRWSRAREQFESYVGGSLNKAMDIPHIVRGNKGGDHNYGVSPVARDGDWVVYIPFLGVTSTDRRGFIVATGDGGETFHTILYKNVGATGIGFLKGLAGITSSNNIVGAFSMVSGPGRLIKIPKLTWNSY